MFIFGVLLVSTLLLYEPISSSGHKCRVVSSPSIDEWADNESLISEHHCGNNSQKDDDWSVEWVVFIRTLFRHMFTGSVYLFWYEADKEFCWHRYHTDINHQWSHCCIAMDHALARAACTSLVTTKNQKWTRRYFYTRCHSDWISVRLENRRFHFEKTWQMHANFKSHTSVKHIGR